MVFQPSFTIFSLIGIYAGDTEINSRSPAFFFLVLFYNSLVLSRDTVCQIVIMIEVLLIGGGVSILC